MMTAFGLIDGITGFEPFDHVNFTPAIEDGDWQPLINFLSFVLAYTVAGPWLIFFATRDASRATDVSQAVMSLHFFLCTTVTQQTPENWIFWATYMPSGIFMGRMAEFMLSRLAALSDGRKRRSDQSNRVSAFCDVGEPQERRVREGSATEVQLRAADAVCTSDCALLRARAQPRYPSRSRAPRRSPRSHPPSVFCVPILYAHVAPAPLCVVSILFKRSKPNFLCVLDRSRLVLR